MNEVEALPCGVCGSNNLLPKWRSDTGEKWVHCDECGNVCSPVFSNDRAEIIAQWNDEQLQVVRTAED